MNRKPAYISFVALIFFIALLSECMGSAKEPTKGMPARPSEPCSIDPLETWTAQEKWVWKQVCAGKIANFNHGKRYGGRLDPKNPEGWPEKRILTSTFLETVLLHEPYRGALTHHGVRITGAWFTEPIDLSNASLPCQLWLNQCRFDSNVDLSRLRSSYWLSLNGSKFKDKLEMEGLKLDSHFTLSSGADFDKAVSLANSKIGGELKLSHSRFGSILKWGNLDVRGGLCIENNTTFDKDVDLVGSKIGGQLVIDNSKFKGKLILEGLEIAALLFRCSKSEFNSDVNLYATKTKGQIEIINSTFRGGLNMNNLDAGGGLLIKTKSESQQREDEPEFNKEGHKTQFEKDVDLLGAKIGGSLVISKYKFKGNVNMSGLEVTGVLRMNQNTEFERSVNLNGAKIGPELDISGCKFKGDVKMGHLEVEGSFNINEVSQPSREKYNAEFERDVNLNGAKIRNQLDMSGSKFKDKLEMEFLEVGKALFLRGTFEKQVKLVFANMGNLDISKGSFSSLDLSGTQINREFSLGTVCSVVELPTGKKEDLIASGRQSKAYLVGVKSPPNWQKTGKLILRNTRVGMLQDLPGAWPDELDLVGFEYSYLGGLSFDVRTSMANRNAEWLENWLMKQKIYSPQPYIQLAKVLKQMGHKDKANDILFYGKERERSNADRLRWFWLSVLRWSIKYGIGYGYFWSLLWVLCFVRLGVGILRMSGEYRHHEIPLGNAYSADMLLPLVRLRECHYDIDLATWARYYFYAHKIVGYVLASFIIAGLSGLTQQL